MTYEWGRFVWWIQHGANSTAIIQSLCAVLATAITGVLCWITYRYMVLTRYLANMATEQLRAMVRPVVAAKLSFQGGIANGASFFTDEVVIEITNAGTVPLIVNRVWAEWEHSPDGEQGRMEVPGFRDVVFAAKETNIENIRLGLKGAKPAVDDFGPWSDFFLVEIHCSDLGKLAPQTYIYQNATGLRLLNTMRGQN